MNKKYLPFFWDYQITKSQLKKILKDKKDKTSKIWAMSRLLESAPYEEIWEYISLDQLTKIFPRLKLKKPIKKAWQHTLDIWAK